MTGAGGGEAGTWTSAWIRCISGRPGPRQRSYCSGQGNGYRGRLRSLPSASGDGRSPLSSPNKVITSDKGAVATNDDALARRGRDVQGPRATPSGNGRRRRASFDWVQLQDDRPPKPPWGWPSSTTFPVASARQRCHSPPLRHVLPAVGSLAHETALWTDILLDNRDRVVINLRAAGYEPCRYWKPSTPSSAYRSNAGAFPNATAFAQKGLWLPSSLTMTDDDVDKVIECIRAERHWHCMFCGEAVYRQDCVRKQEATPLES